VEYRSAFPSAPSETVQNAAPSVAGARNRSCSG
jgi:hypothetical protein